MIFGVTEPNQTGVDKMKNLKRWLLAGASMCMLHAAPAIAQDEAEGVDVSALALEEIVVTARKREESLMDVPVSTSVLNDALIEDANITTLYDLYEMVPGLHFDEEQDRLAALPSIRGIQANDIAPNRTKVTSFVDGIPVLGSAGSIGFFGFQQVEVYRGPQSAAFGRSTFGGAVNYVTANPGDTFEGNVGINYNDFGTRTANVSVGGPILENLGFLLNYSHEDSTTPEIWHANGNYGYRDDLIYNGGPVETNVDQADGTEFGARTGGNLSGKLVFEPDDTLRLAMTFTSLETHDQRAPVMFLDQPERDACFEDSGVFVDAGMMAPWLLGEIDCDWDNARDLYSQHDVEHWLNVNPANMDHLVEDALNDMGFAMGMAIRLPVAGPFTMDDGTVLSIEEQILLMAKAYSIPEGERGTKSARDRIAFQADKLLTNGSAVQFSYMQSDETFQRANATGFYYYDPDNFGIVDDGVPNTFDMNANGANIQWEGPVNRWRIYSGMGAPRLPNPSFGDIEEQYAELRWVSPAENRLSWVLGASFYQYDYLEERWNSSPAAMGMEPIAGTAQFNGIIDEFMQLSGFGLTGDPYAADHPQNEIIGEQAQNSAVFFNAGYDITDRLTFSVEGRSANDVVGATNVSTGISEEVTTRSFVPRVSLTYNPNENTSYYFQWAQGVNPAGINVGVLTGNTLDILRNGVPYGLTPYNRAAAETDLINNDTGEAVPDGTSDAFDNTAEPLGVWYTDGTQTTRLPGETYWTEYTYDDFIAYKEEQITQLEFGFKGNALNGRLTYAGAVYWIDWADQIQNGAIDLDSPCSENPLAGDTDPIPGPCVVDGMEYMYVNASAGANVATSLNFGDVENQGRGKSKATSASTRTGIFGRRPASCRAGTTNSATSPCSTRSTSPSWTGPIPLASPAPGTGPTTCPPWASTCVAPEKATRSPALATSPMATRSPISPRSAIPSVPITAMDFGNLRYSARLDIRHEGKQYDNSANFNWYPAATTANLNLSVRGAAWSATLYVSNLTDEDSPRNVFGFPDDVSQMGLLDYVTNPNTPMTGYLGETWTYLDLARDSFQFRPRNPRSVGVRANYRF